MAELKRVKLMRGNEASRLSVTPAQGEQIMTTNELKLYLGDGNKAGGFIVNADNTIAVWPDQTDATKKLSLAWWIAYFNGAEATIRIPRGTHEVLYDMTIPENICLQFDKGAILEIADTKTLTINGAIDAGLWCIFDGDGAITTTLKNTVVSYPQWFGAKGDGITNDTAAIQKSIDFTKNVYVPNGTYMCANVQMRTGLNLLGESHEAILKLCDNAMLMSINGSVERPHHSGVAYTANVIGSTLSDIGGEWYDGGVRAVNENNTEYIYENINIRSLTVDGNRENNLQYGDEGFNTSYCGGINIAQCKNVRVENCVIRNCRMDGITIGYTLHGGSDFCSIVGCEFYNNARCNISLLTGKHNKILYNKGTNTTGATPTSGTITKGPSIDIEANFANEVNFGHLVEGNVFEGGIDVSSAQRANSKDIVIKGNRWINGALSIHPSTAQNLLVDGDIFERTGAREGVAINSVSSYMENSKICKISRCVFKNYASIFKSTIMAQGQHMCLDIDSCTFDVGVIGYLTFPFKVRFTNNTITTNCTDNETLMYISRSNLSGAPYQGYVTIQNNRIYGAAAAMFLDVTSPPINKNEGMYRIEDNQLYIDALTKFCAVSSHITFVRNFATVSSCVVEPYTSLIETTFVQNTFTAPTISNFFSPANAHEFKNCTLSGNVLKNISINIIRPQNCNIKGNVLTDGKIVLLYSFTSGGVGKTFVTDNDMRCVNAVIDSPFKATTGISFSTANFTGNDVYKRNAYVGYTGAPSIDESLADVVTGTFD